MREKIIAQLKAKLLTLGVKNLSGERLNAIADKLAPRITEETDIDGKLDELNELYPFAEIARQDDRLRTLEAQSKKQKPAAQSPATPADDDSQTDTEKTGDDTTTLLKTLLQEVSALKKEKTQSSIKSKAAEKLKDVPASFYKNWTLPESEDDLESFVQSVQTEYTAFQQEFVDTGLATVTKPAKGQTATATAAVDAEIKAWGEKTKENKTN